MCQTVSYAAVNSRKRRQFLGLTQYTYTTASSPTRASEAVATMCYVCSDIDICVRLMYASRQTTGNINLRFSEFLKIYSNLFLSTKRTYSVQLRIVL